MQTIPRAIAELLGMVGVPLQTADTQESPLALSSLQVIQIVDAVEVAFDVVLPTAAIIRENFATPAAIAALLRAHGVPLD